MSTSRSRRQDLKARRQKKRQQQRRNAILTIIAGVLIIMAIIIVPILIQNLQPVGEIKNITPIDRSIVDGTTMGDPNAPVKMDIFEDFQCSACRIYTEQVENQLIEPYIATGKVYYVFHQYPFIDDGSGGKESDQTANASMCAAEQGRFWDYHDILFTNWNGENANAFNDRRLVAFAETLNLDMLKFNTCFRVNTYKNQIEEDLELGKQMGVTGTPSVFVNGEQVTPGYIPSFADLQQAIEAALESASSPAP